MTDEGDSLGGRLGRYARVGSSVGGLAVKLAGQRYLGLTLDRGQAAPGLHGGGLGRDARVGSSVGGLAVKLAGQRYLGWTLDRDKHASELKAALGGLKG